MNLNKTLRRKMRIQIRVSQQPNRQLRHLPLQRLRPTRRLLPSLNKRSLHRRHLDQASRQQRPRRKIPNNLQLPNQRNRVRARKQKRRHRVEDRHPTARAPGLRTPKTITAEKELITEAAQRKWAAEPPMGGWLWGY